MKTHRETARATWWRRLLPAARLAIVAAGLTAASCGKTNNYDYVDVSVYVDPNSVSRLAFLDPANIDSCEMYVTGSETAPTVVLPCMPSSQSYPGLGTFEWTTTLGKGSAIQFTVTLYALNHVVWAMGTSAPVTIMPGQKQTANVVVTLVPATGMTGTGGAGVGTGTGGSPGLGGAGGGSAGTGGTAGVAGSGGTAGAGGMPGTGGTAGRGAGGVGGGRGGAGGGAGGSSSSSGGAGGAGTAGAGGESAGGAGGS